MCTAAVEVPRPAKHMLQASPFPDFMGGSSNNIQDSHCQELIDGSSSNVQASLVPALAEGTSNEPIPRQLFTGTSHNAQPAGPEHADPITLDEEELLKEIKSLRTDNLLDLPKITRARLYHHFIANPDSLKILTDKHGEFKDFPAHCEEDFALLRTLTHTYGDDRWWTIMINDLICPECVLLIRDKRQDSKSRYRKAWLKIMGRIRRLCLCGDNSHDFVCRHDRRDTNKVKRFFSSLGKENASRMVNIELHTNPEALVDIDILASAAYNVKKYFKALRKLKIRFRFDEGVPVDPQLLKGIVCSLARLEALLPAGERLTVQGFESHEECQKAWKKKSRKFWQ